VRNGKIQSHENKTVIMKARQKKFLSRSRGEHENCPAFFPITLPDHTEYKDLFAPKPVKLRSN